MTHRIPARCRRERLLSPWLLTLAALGAGGCALTPEDSTVPAAGGSPTRDAGPVFRAPPADVTHSDASFADTDSTGAEPDAIGVPSDGSVDARAPGGTETPSDTAAAGDLMPTDATLPADVSPSAPCEPVGSAGCGEGLQCFPDPGGNLCLAPGKKPHGVACNGWNDCAWGHLCVGGVCRTICDTAGGLPWTCKPGVPCEKIVFSGAGAAGKNLGACKPGDACDLLTDKGCGSAQTCVPSGWLKACVGAGTAAAGATCTSAADCSQGFLCLDAGGAAVCRKKCSTAGGDPACSGKCSALVTPDGLPHAGDAGFCVQ